jgi:DNA-nicking Smr family endonuclease
MCCQQIGKFSPGYGFTTVPECKNYIFARPRLPAGTCKNTISALLRKLFDLLTVYIFTYARTDKTMLSILKKILQSFSSESRHPETRRRTQHSLPEEIPEKKKTDGKKKKNRKSLKKKENTKDRGKHPRGAEKKSTGKPPRPSANTPRHKKNPLGLNRHGIAVYEKNTDFSEFFKETADTQTAGPSRRRRMSAPKRQKRKKQNPNVNKNGIPILHREDDLYQFFLNASEEMPGSLPDNSGHSDEKSYLHSISHNREDEYFQRMIEESMAGKEMEDIMDKKYEGAENADPPPLRTVLRTYPMPQEELDLHGCSAEEAEERTEDFIRKARQKGKRTLLIIVGKGLHSDGKAVLPDIVENKIVLLKQKNWVMTYAWEKKIRRKSGALIVYLKDMYE